MQPTNKKLITQNALHLNYGFGPINVYTLILKLKHRALLYSLVI